MTRFLTRSLCLTAMLASSAFAETLVLDPMDTNQSAWGPAASTETKLVREGRAALRWSPEAGTLERGDLVVNLREHHSLRLWIYSPVATFARVRMDVPVEGEDTPFSLSFKVDWSGWNRMELPEARFRQGPKDRAAGWAKARGIRLTQVEPGFVPGFLILDGLEVSTDWPQIHFSDDEKLIDWMYWGAEGSPLWSPTEETLREPEGSFGLSRYWCWGYPWTIEDPKRRNVCAYTREFGTDVTGYGTLEVRLSNDAQGYLSVHVQTDGEWSTPVAYHKGTGHFEEIQIPLPEAARRLDAVTLDISEPADEIGGSAGRQLKCNVHWLLLRKRGAQKGSPPQPVPKIEPIPLNGTIEEDGLPAGVYFGREDLPAIRKLFLEGAGRSVFARQKSAADGYLKTEPEQYAGKWFPSKMWVSSRSDKVNFSLSNAAMTTALAYVITGEKKYADYARRALLVASRIDQWVSGEFARFPLGWGGHGNVFDESSISYGLGLAYDWAYTALADDERREVEEALLRKGIWWIYDSLDHSPGLLKMNQGAVFDSQMGCALMALEPARPELREMREQSEKWIWQTLVDYSLQDGESNEGVGYWHYTWNTAVRLLAAMGKRDPEGLLARCPERVKQSMDWLAHMKSNTSEGHLSLFLCDATGGQPSPAVSAFFAKYLGSETAAWFQQTHGGPSDLLSALMWQHDTRATEPKRVPARHFRGAGYVFLREGFEYGDTLFAMLGGPKLSGHDQRDRASFIIEAFGEHLAMDPGMISYDNPIHTSLANTRLHNTLTIDGGEARSEAKVTGFFTSPLLDYVAVNATRAYPQSESYLRRALYLRPDHFVVSDNMQLKEPARIEWNLNSAGELALDGSRVIATASRAELVVDFATPRKLSMQTETWPCGHRGVENHHGTFVGEEASREGRFLVSLYPVRKGLAQEIDMEPINAKGVEGVRLRRGDEEEVVLERTGEGTVGWKNLEFEGEMAAVTGGVEEIRGAAVIEGTKLVFEGEPMLSASTRGSYSIQYRDKYAWAVASVQAAPGTEVRFLAPKRGPYHSVQVGSVAGGFRTGALSQAERMAQFTVPDGEPPQGGYWLVLDAPAGLDLEGQAPAKLAEVLVDGKPLKGALPDGSVPKQVEMKFTAGANPIDPASVRAYFDGKPVGPSAREVREATAGTVTVALAIDKLLPPEDRKPKFFTTHVAEVEVRDRSLLPRRAAGRARFSIRPVIEDGAVYLSDLKPKSSFVHGGVLLDRAYSSDRITVGDMDFAKGLTTHPETRGASAYAEVIYDMTPYKGKRTAFRALVGMQDDASGSVTFEVHTRAAGGEWKKQFETGTLTDSSDPVEVNVSLEGVDELRLYVTGAGDGINSDHAVWAMARLE